MYISVCEWVYCIVSCPSAYSLCASVCVADASCFERGTCIPPLCLSHTQRMLPQTLVMAHLRIRLWWPRKVGVQPCVSPPWVSFASQFHPQHSYLTCVRVFVFVPLWFPPKYHFVITTVQVNQHMNYKCTNYSIHTHTSTSLFYGLIRVQTDIHKWMTHTLTHTCVSTNTYSGLWMAGFCCANAHQYMEKFYVKV